MGEDGQPPRQVACRLRFLERGGQVDQGAVVDAAATLRSGDGEADRRVGLAHVRRAEQHHVLLARDEVELVQALDLLALERRLEGEVEAFQRLHRRQAG